MKNRFAIIACLALVHLAAYGNDTPAPPKADPNNDNHALDPKKPDIVKTSTNAEWRMWYIAKGTRSEGLHGTLAVDGKWISGKTNGETANTDLGEFVWRGNWDNRSHLFSKSGWLPANLSPFYPSWTTNSSKQSMDGTEKR